MGLSAQPRLGQKRRDESIERTYRPIPKYGLGALIDLYHQPQAFRIGFFKIEASAPAGSTVGHRVGTTG